MKWEDSGGGGKRRAHHDEVNRTGAPSRSMHYSIHQCEFVWINFKEVRDAVIPFAKHVIDVLISPV